MAASMETSISSALLLRPLEPNEHELDEDEDEDEESAAMAPENDLRWSSAAAAAFFLIKVAGNLLAILEVGLVLWSKKRDLR